MGLGTLGPFAMVTCQSSWNVNSISSCVNSTSTRCAATLQYTSLLLPAQCRTRTNLGIEVIQGLIQGGDGWYSGCLGARRTSEIDKGILHAALYVGRCERRADYGQAATVCPSLLPSSFAVQDQVGWSSSSPVDIHMHIFATSNQHDRSARRGKCGARKSSRRH